MVRRDRAVEGFPPKRITLSRVRINKKQQRMPRRSDVPVDLDKNNEEDSEAVGEPVRASSLGPSAAGSQLGAGDSIGPYQVLSLVGSGPTGEVYLAARESADPSDGRVSLGLPRAVKVIHGYLIANPLVREQLHMELQTAAVLRHDAAVKLVEASLDSDPPWVATEHVPGPTLWSRVRRLGPLEGDELDELVHGLAGTIQALKAVGLVHRGIHPRNVVMSPTGARLVDIGVSFLTHHGVSTGRSEPTTPTTMLAPEMTVGIAPGPPADVYGWGLTVGFAAVGSLPEPGDVWDLDPVPEPYRALVEQSLSHAVQARPTVDQLVAGLGGEVAGAASVESTSWPGSGIASVGSAGGQVTPWARPYASELVAPSADERTARLPDHRAEAFVGADERAELAKLVPPADDQAGSSLAISDDSGSRDESGASLGALTAFGREPLESPTVSGTVNQAETVSATAPGPTALGPTGPAGSPGPTGPAGPTSAAEQLVPAGAAPPGSGAAATDVAGPPPGPANDQPMQVLPSPKQKRSQRARRPRRWFPVVMAALLTLSLGTIAFVLLLSGEDGNDGSDDDLIAQQLDEVDAAADSPETEGDDAEAGTDGDGEGNDGEVDGGEADGDDEGDGEPEVEPPTGICPDPGSLDWPPTTLGPALSCPDYPAGIPSKARSESGQGWVAILSALPIQDPDRVDERAAELVAQIEAEEERTVDVGLYDTRHFSGLRDPFWVLFAGPFPSEAQAVEYCETHPYLTFCVPRELGESAI